MKRALPFLISGVITAVIMVTLSFFIEDAAQAKSTMVAGLIVAVVIVAIPIYDINRWSLLQRSLVHFVAMAVTVLPLFLYVGWFTVPVSIIVFVLFGIVGWAIGYFVNALQIRKSQELTAAASRPLPQ